MLSWFAVVLRLLLLFIVFGCWVWVLMGLGLFVCLIWVGTLLLGLECFGWSLICCAFDCGVFGVGLGLSFFLI